MWSQTCQSIGNECGTIIVRIVMRRQSIWLRLFALLALIPLVVPMSAQAAFCQAHPAGMACCMGHREGKPQKKSVTAPSCCQSKAFESISSGNEISIGVDTHCKCTFGSYPKQISHESVVSIGSTVPSVDHALALPPVHKNPSYGSYLVVPSIYFGDSSPPIVGHFSASLGRAPPVYHA